MEKLKEKGFEIIDGLDKFSEMGSVIDKMKIAITIGHIQKDMSESHFAEAVLQAILKVVIPKIEPTEESLLAIAEEVMTLFDKEMEDQEKTVVKDFYRTVVHAEIYKQLYACRPIKKD